MMLESVVAQAYIVEKSKELAQNKAEQTLTNLNKNVKGYN